MEASTLVSVPTYKNMKPESNHDNDVDANASSSSSFSDLETYGFDTDNEVMSDIRDDGPSTRAFGGSNDLFKKKKVTPHWRKFVQPIMWQCKWVELQLMKFESMTNTYKKEIEKYNQLESCCAKSMPFIHDSQRQKLMKRKIRKKLEESDSEAYMSLHNLSSYLGPTMDDDDDQTNSVPFSHKDAGNELLLSFNFRGDYSSEQILYKIEVSQLQVSKMKNRLDMVTTENAERISSTKDLILNKSNIAMTRPVKEPDFSTDMKGPSKLMKLNTGDDMVKIKNTASEINHVKDANEPVEPPRVASRKRSADGVLIYNRRPKKPQTESGIKVHPMKRLRVSEEEKNNNNNKTIVSVEDLSQNEQPAKKIRSISKLTTKKKAKMRADRARCKSGSSLRSRRTLG